MLNFLLGSSMISTNPILSPFKQKGLSFQSGSICVHCENKLYLTKRLDAAAKNACSHYKKDTTCRGFFKSRYIKKIAPIVSCTTIYKGNKFQEYVLNNELLLEWPLSSTINILDQKRDYAIVQYNPDTKTCKPISATRRAPKLDEEACHVLGLKKSLKKNKVMRRGIAT
ncbi:hypothetical protein OnM2_080054 [Erysiphe neolycopersici]|uniref:Uncharacterized protein n=1 Tax=Erysiphe neolycopersici TaxID=212602 RepID=A0A420HGV3_9PEZI|nr:hypothetical protein OnM2_080054 [Erysiphe neolycopersici]